MTASTQPRKRTTTISLQKWQHLGWFDCLLLLTASLLQAIDSIPLTLLILLRVKSYEDSFLYPTFLLVRISINKPRPRSKLDSGLSRGRVQTWWRSGYGRVVYPWNSWSMDAHDQKKNTTVKQWTSEGTATPPMGGSKCTNHSRHSLNKWCLVLQSTSSHEEDQQ